MARSSARSAVLGCLVCLSGALGAGCATQGSAAPAPVYVYDPEGVGQEDAEAVAWARQNPAARPEPRPMYPEKAPPAQPSAAEAPEPPAPPTQPTQPSSPPAAATATAPVLPPASQPPTGNAYNSDVPGYATPETRYVWAPGYWHWYGSSYVWVEGAWLPPRAGYVYLSPRWMYSPRGWVFAEGGWATPGSAFVVYPVYRHRHYYAPYGRARVQRRDYGHAYPSRNYVDRGPRVSEHRRSPTVGTRHVHVAPSTRVAPRRSAPAVAPRRSVDRVRTAPPAAGNRRSVGRSSGSRRSR